MSTPWDSYRAFCAEDGKKLGLSSFLRRLPWSLLLLEGSTRFLSADEHADFLRKKKMDPYKYRPDIVHDALGRIMNSRLCRAGKVQAVYVKTDQGILIKIEPHTRIPKNLGKFCAMMCEVSSLTGGLKHIIILYCSWFLSVTFSSLYFVVTAAELLQKFSVRARGKCEKLLSVIKNPVTQYLPFNSYKRGLSFISQKLVELEDYVATINNDVNLVFVVGAMAHGKIDSKYIDDFISGDVPPTYGLQWFVQK